MPWWQFATRDTQKHVVKNACGGVLKSSLYIGTAGWSYPDWKGTVYPAGQRSRFDPLAFMASYFNLVEVNSSFYRVPAASVTARWASRVVHRPDFQFTVKAFREFTHARTPARDSDKVQGARRWRPPRRAQSAR